jgi:hypothetical protein
MLTNCNYNKLKVELILDCLKVGVKLIETDSTGKHVTDSSNSS